MQIQIHSAGGTMLGPRSEKHLADKSPLHDSALRIGDINPGKHIVRYTPYGIVEYRVLSRPYVARLPHHGDGPMIVVKLMTLRPDHSILSIPLELMGIIPHPGTKGWDAVNFCVDVSRRHLLPLAPRMSPYGYSYVRMGPDRRVFWIY